MANFEVEFQNDNLAKEAEFGEVRTVTVFEKGDKGDDGDSAYEVAKRNGFDGTEEEWLASLRGEPGQDLTEKPWVLIDNIKLTEDTTKIVPNFPAGTYKEMYIRGVIGFSKTDGSTNAITTYITLGNLAGSLSFVRTTTVGTLGKQAYRYIVEAKMMPDGMPFFESKQSAYSSFMAGNGNQMYYNTAPNGIDDKEYLPPFSIYITTANVCFNDGTNLKIWGR